MAAAPTLLSRYSYSPVRCVSSSGAGSSNFGKVDGMATRGLGVCIGVDAKEESGFASKSLAIMCLAIAMPT